MPLPNAESAIVDDRKLVLYCLNLDHPRGKHKAKVFLSALGLSAKDAPVLLAALLKAVREVEAVPGKSDRFGVRFLIDFEMQHRTRRARVRAVWTVSEPDRIPRLTTCYVL